MKKTLETRRAAELAGSESTGARTADFLRQQIANEQSPLHSALANIGVVIGFVAFAYAVKYVLRSLTAE